MVLAQGLEKQASLTPEELRRSMPNASNTKVSDKVKLHEEKISGAHEGTHRTDELNNNEVDRGYEQISRRSSSTMVLDRVKTHEQNIFNVQEGKQRTSQSKSSDEVRDELDRLKDSLGSGQVKTRMEDYEEHVQKHFTSNPLKRKSSVKNLVDVKKKKIERLGKEIGKIIKEVKNLVDVKKRKIKRLRKEIGKIIKEVKNLVDVKKKKIERLGKEMKIKEVKNLVDVKKRKIERLRKEMGKIKKEDLGKHHVKRKKSNK